MRCNVKITLLKLILQPPCIHLQGACELNFTSNYDSSLTESALSTLRNIKHEIAAENYHNADMWCHFGTVIIRDPDESKYCADLETLEFDLPQSALYVLSSAKWSPTLSIATALEGGEGGEGGKGEEGGEGGELDTWGGSQWSKTPKRGRSGGVQNLLFIVFPIHELVYRTL